jgi:hypothetical protein
LTHLPAVVLEPVVECGNAENGERDGGEEQPVFVMNLTEKYLSTTSIPRNIMRRANSSGHWMHLVVIKLESDKRHQREYHDSSNQTSMETDPI